ncbi:MAG: metallophosphoesterase [Dehalococcoidia bacterium]|nr:metallophosphoesterase [Dehalococcoidia bacterium]
MNRWIGNRVGVFLLAVMASIMLVSFVSTAPAAAQLEPLALMWGPYITGTTATSVVINAKTSEPTTMNLEWATDAYYNEHHSYPWAAAHTDPDTMHNFPLTGLESDTVYHYRLNDGAGFSDDYHFRTFPTSGPFTFIVYGDTQDQLPSFSQYERYKLVADAVAAEQDIAFVLHCGDLVNNGNEITDWDRYFDVSRQLMANTTVYPALGNHEKNSALFYGAFGIAPYYSFDCGDAHFTVLDSINTSDTEAAWLGSDLDNSKPWKFVSFHYPMYTSDPNHFGGWANLQEEWEDLFQTHDVAAVWNGHIHAYEHYLENGIHYAVMGTGGGPPGLLNPTKYEGYQNSLENSMAYAKVRINPPGNTATVQIIRVADISADGTQVTTTYPPGTVYDTFVMILPGTQPQWDLNGDHICNIGDVVKVGLKWGLTGNPGWISEDVNTDGVINISDVAAIGLHWGDTWQ